MMQTTMLSIALTVSGMAPESGGERNLTNPANLLPASPNLSSTHPVSAAPSQLQTFKFFLLVMIVTWSFHVQRACALKYQKNSWARHCHQFLLVSCLGPKPIFHARWHLLISSWGIIEMYGNSTCFPHNQ